MRVTVLGVNSWRGLPLGDSIAGNKVVAGVWLGAHGGEMLHVILTCWKTPRY